MHAGKLSKSADEDGELRRVFFSFHPHVHTSSYQWAERSGRRPCNGRAQEQTHIELVCGLSGNKETPSPAGCSAAGVQQGARLCACRGSTGPQLLFKIERKRAWSILAAAFWRCLWLSFWGGGGEGNWFGWQMALNRKGGSVCLQTLRGVIPLLPGSLDKISVGAFCQLPQPHNAARQMNQRQPESRSVPQKSFLGVRRAGENVAEIHCQARTRTTVPRISRLAWGTGGMPSASLHL